jgi:peptidoglycan/LPS O-acetylase OafA/YrhL
MRVPGGIRHGFDGTVCEWALIILARSSIFRTDASARPTRGKQWEWTACKMGKYVNKSDRLVALDIGRAIAIFGVVAVHLSPWISNLPIWLLLPAKSGEYGVQLFFVISAYTICKSLSDERYRGFQSSTLIQRFYLKRFARIVPLYYVGIILYGFLDLIAMKTVHSRVLSVHDAWDILANVLFVHAFVPTAINSVVPGGWSIGVEMAFYAVAPVLFVMCNSRCGFWLTATTILGLCYGAERLALYIAGENFVIHGTFIYYWPATQFPCFLTGIGLWTFWTSRAINEQQNGRVMMGACLGVALLYPTLLVSGVGLNLATGVAPLIAAATGASVLLLLLSSPWLATKVNFIKRFGEKSYGIYIWHFVGVLIFRIFLKEFDARMSGVPAIVLFVAGMAFVIAFAYGTSSLTERIIEKPVSQWMRKRLPSSVRLSNVLAATSQHETG